MSTRLKRQIVSVAREQIGAHYVWGAYGNIPGVTACRFQFPGSFGQRVQMWQNDPQGNRRDHGRTQPIMFTAFTRINGRIYICGGRTSRVASVPHADFSSELAQATREVYTWPRPDDTINSGRTIWGESCDGVRHFDCIGFVNWCYWRVVGRRIQYSIEQWRSRSATRPINIADVEAGDILSAASAGGQGNTRRHIGIATGNGTVVHARSYRIGVEETPVQGGGTSWDYAGRPIASVFPSGAS